MSNSRFGSHFVELLRITPICAGIVVAGCGGAGGSKAGEPAGSVKTTQAGNATAAFSGTPHPLEVMVSGGVSAFSQAGASLSSFSITPTPLLSTTSLAFSRSLGTNTQAYIMPADGSQAPGLFIHTAMSALPSFSNSGLLCILTQVGGQYTIETLLSDGSGAHVVISNLPAYPTISPNGQTIAYYNVNDRNIYTIPSGGGSPKLVYSGGNAYPAPVMWSHDGSQIAFSAANASLTHWEPYTILASGGVATDVMPAGLAGNGDVAVSGWSTDGLSLALTFTPTNSATSTIVMLSMNGDGYVPMTPAGYSDSYACFSPDGKKIAFYRTNAGGAAPGIYEADFSGTNPELIYADPASNGASGPLTSMAWSPFQPKATFIGTGGSLGQTTASGFLMAQTNDLFASLLSMTATTPTTAKITPTGTQAPGGPLVYTLTADAITNISFANIYQGNHTSINLTTTPTVVVSIDGTTGAVDFVAPGVVKKGPGGTFSGKFSAIYDRTGKNIAPAGASLIDFDHSTEKLLAFH